MPVMTLCLLLMMIMMVPDFSFVPDMLLHRLRWLVSNQLQLVQVLSL